MAEFGDVSKANLATADQRLQNLFNEVIKYVDCRVICGHRGKEEQDAAVANGTSTKPWPTSKHNANPSLAVDVMPYPIDWNDVATITHFAGVVRGIAAEMGLGDVIRWGGDWNRNFKLGEIKDSWDKPHYELLDTLLSVQP